MLLDFTDRPDFHEAARGWQDRIEIRSASVDDRPADAVLIRPDAYVAWAAAIDEPTITAVPALREALAYWCGEPGEQVQGIQPKDI